MDREREYCYVVYSANYIPPENAELDKPIIYTVVFGVRRTLKEAWDLLGYRHTLLMTKGRGAEVKPSIFIRGNSVFYVFDDGEWHDFYIVRCKLDPIDDENSKQSIPSVNDEKLSKEGCTWSTGNALLSH